MKHSERLCVTLLGTLWLLHLLLYVWIVPPWQHYDEPTHFEYAALIRELGRLPTMDEQIVPLRRAIANSMLESGFFHSSELPLTAPDPNDPNLSLGINERGHPPLYYTLVALGTFPFRSMPIETQLYAARGVSVVLALLLFAAAYALLRVLFREQWRLRCAIVAALALQPAFVDNISSVNSDVLANLVAVLLLLVALIVLQKPSWRVALVSVLVIVLAWNTKRTLLAYSLIVPIAWLVVAPRFVWRTAVASASVGLAVGIGWLFVTPWQLADWQGTSVALETRAAGMQLGSNAFVLGSNQSLSQTVYPYRLKNTSVEQLTFGAWMRAEQPISASSLVVVVDGMPTSRIATLQPTWQLITVSAELASDRSTVEIQLHGAPNTTVYADALVLVEGNTPLPDENTPDGSFEPGVLGSILQHNLVRNASAERRVPVLPPILLGAFGGVFDGGMAQTLSTLFNPRWILAVYPQQVWLLFVGSWGIFGWGQYTINPGWFTPLAMLVVASIVGSARLLLPTTDDRRPTTEEQGEQSVISRQSSAMWWLCAVAVIIGWGIALLRVHNQPFPGSMFWSFGRYTFVAMVPGLVFFVVGLRAVLPTALRNQATAAQLAFLLVFAVIAASVFLLPQ